MLFRFHLTKNLLDLSFFVDHEAARERVRSLSADYGLALDPDETIDLDALLADGEVPRLLDAEKARSMELERVDLDESHFRWSLNENPMATEKLAEGIRRFAADADKLLAMVTA